MADEGRYERILEHIVEIREELVDLTDTLRELVVQGRQQVWMNRVLVVAITVLAGAEKALSFLRP